MTAKSLTDIDRYMIFIYIYIYMEPETKSSQPVEAFWAFSAAAGEARGGAEGALPLKRSE